MELISIKSLKNLTISVFILIPFQVNAVTVTDAINANKNNKSVEAVKILTQLANSGNTVAQYNLANHYSAGIGVQIDEEIAEEWSKDAARKGLIQAYLNLNSQAIKPANGISLTFTVSPSSWLSKQEPNRYTIQLASSQIV